MAIAKEEIVKSFLDRCILAYECWRMNIIMRSYVINENSGVWARFDTILQHYFILQVAKINDPEKHGNDYNFSLAYIVALVNKPSYTDSYNKFRDDNKEFIRATTEARVKIVAHRDLKTFNSGNGKGAFNPGLDENYFDSLHKIISGGYKELGLGVCPEWPSFIEDDTKIFMNKIEETFRSKVS